MKWEDMCCVSLLFDNAGFLTPYSLLDLAFVNLCVGVVQTPPFLPPSLAAQRTGKLVTSRRVLPSCSRQSSVHAVLCCAVLCLSWADSKGSVRSHLFLWTLRVGTATASQVGQGSRRLLLFSSPSKPTPPHPSPPRPKYCSTSTPTSTIQNHAPPRRYSVRSCCYWDRSNPILVLGRCLESKYKKTCHSRMCSGPFFPAPIYFGSILQSLSIEDIVVRCSVSPRPQSHDKDFPVSGYVDCAEKRPQPLVRIWNIW